MGLDPDSWVGGWPEGENVLHRALSQQPMAFGLMRAFVALLWNAFKGRGPSGTKRFFVVLEGGRFDLFLTRKFRNIRLNSVIFRSPEGGGEMRW